MTMPNDWNQPTADDIGRFCVDLAATFDIDNTDERSNAVFDMIKTELTKWPEFLHAAFLTASLRTFAAHYYATPARRIERENPGTIYLALQAQALQNDGLIGPPSAPDAPHLFVVPPLDNPEASR